MLPRIAIKTEHTAYLVIYEHAHLPFSARFEAKCFRVCQIKVLICGNTPALKIRNDALPILTRHNGQMFEGAIASVRHFAVGEIATDDVGIFRKISMRSAQA